MALVKADSLALACRQEQEISAGNFERLAARGKILTGVDSVTANEAKLEAMYEKGKADAYAAVANTMERIEAEEGVTEDVPSAPMEGVR